MEQYFKTKFLEELKESREAEAERLAYGNVTNMQDYGKHCGAIRAINAIEEAFLELWDKHHGRE